MSIYRNAVWLVKGLQEYTKSGYEAAAKRFTPGDLDVKVTGRSFVITGANSGIGKRAALEIANRGERFGFGFEFHNVPVNSSQLRIGVAANKMDAAAWPWEERFTWCVVTRSGQKQLRRKSLIRAKIRREALQKCFLHTHTTLYCVVVVVVASSVVTHESPLNRFSLPMLIWSDVHVHIVDMSSARQVWEFAQNFTQKNTVHVLINNAGCMVNQRELTEEGLEKNFATNTLGTYILTTALIPALKTVEHPRVITVSSGGMLVQKLNMEDLQFEKGAFDGTMAYAQNKRQQVILTERWASQHKDIHFSSMHPGWADTPAVRLSMPDFHAKMQNKLRTEAMGADTVVWLAVSTAAGQQPSGLFFQDRKAVATHLPLAFSRSSPQDEERLQATLDQLSAKFNP
ncbi:Dehydrogenase/reductase SDR family member 12 [Merluccius polli]|uniref:Dehydrogenase/reductase SDR family member 12 n=1 Tax=Merluccius polli TaxID=89951 RepID=A0AA47P8D5_MERPO|nr:Dehydrogenase/reductase SDR family member 12 [Merluccius polli]